MTWLCYQETLMGRSLLLHYVVLELKPLSNNGYLHKKIVMHKWWSDFKWWSKVILSVQTEMHFSRWDIHNSNSKLNSHFLRPNFFYNFKHSKMGKNKKSSSNWQKVTYFWNLNTDSNPLTPKGSTGSTFEYSSLLKVYIGKICGTLFSFKKKSVLFLHEHQNQFWKWKKMFFIRNNFSDQSCQNHDFDY